MLQWYVILKENVYLNDYVKWFLKWIGQMRNGFENELCNTEMVMKMI